jgi:hypothetical protein
VSKPRVADIVATAKAKDLRDLAATDQGKQKIRALAATAKPIQPEAGKTGWVKSISEDGRRVIDWRKYYETTKIDLAATVGMDADEIRDTLPPPVIHGIVRQGSVVLLAGASKSRKSWLALALSLAVRTGGSFIGFRTEQAQVRYLDFELKERTGRARYSLARLGLTDDVDLQNQIDAGFSYHSLRCHPNEEGRLAGIGEWMLASAAVGEVWILDCLQPALEVDQNDALAVRRELGPLLSAASVTGAVLVIVDHYNKSSESRGMSRVSGSVAKVAAVDTIVTLTPKTDGVIEVDFDLREDPPVDGQTLIRFNSQTHGFDLVTSEQLATVEEKQLAEKLADWIATGWQGEREPKTAAALAHAWQLDPTGGGLRKRLAALDSAGLVELAGKIGRANSWQLVPVHRDKLGQAGTSSQETIEPLGIELVPPC